MHRTPSLTSAILLASVVFLIGGPTPSQAIDGYFFEAEIAGSHEVPPTAAPQTGHVTLTLNAEQTQASNYIEYDELPDETMAHFHETPPGSNGSVVLWLPEGNPKVGVWDLEPEHATALMQGNIYVNIHTTTYPGRAIRGNLTTYTVGVESSTWEQVKRLFR